MTPTLCKKHFREVANYFDKETALLYMTEEKGCLICNKVIFVEGARRFVLGNQPRSNEEVVRLPDAFAQLGA